MTMPNQIKATPCTRCGNEVYNILGTKIEGGRIIVQNPVCNTCGTPLQSAGNHPNTIVGQP